MQVRLGCVAITHAEATRPTDEYHCLGCGSGGEYRLAKEDDVPRGATINPVICDALADEDDR